MVYDKKPLKRYKQNIASAHLKDKFKNLDLLKNKINSIKNCELKKSAQQIVFSDGNPDAKIMIIGEGPGANEDKEGKPFVGRAGKLLDKMLQAIKLNRDRTSAVAFLFVKKSFLSLLGLLLFPLEMFPAIILLAEDEEVAEEPTTRTWEYRRAVARSGARADVCG